MMKHHLVSSALIRLHKARALILSQMADAGIPGAHVTIDGDRDGYVLCTLSSSAHVFACGVARLRRRRSVIVVYGPQVTEAIEMAERFIRRGTQP